VTELDHEARQKRQVARRRRRWWFFFASLLLILGLSAVGWRLAFPPLTDEERPFVGRWEVPRDAEVGLGTYEWEFKSNHTVRRRMIQNGIVQPGSENEMGWSVSDGKLVLVHRHSDWAWRLKSGNTQLTETSDAALAWDGPDRFSFALLSPDGKALKPMVLVRKRANGAD